MVRYKDISQKPRLRARLRVSAIILMILGAVLPYLFMITFGFGDRTRRNLCALLFLGVPGVLSVASYPPYADHAGLDRD